MDAQAIAERSAAAMWSNDKASKWLGFELVSVRPGSAVLRLTVAGQHCNGHGFCHGGVSFALADSAFAFACNSYGERCVGQHNMISYLRPIAVGDVLTAEAREVSRSKRSGIYDVSINNQNNRKCVEMRGFSHRVEGEWL